MRPALELAIPSDVQYIEGIVAEIVARCAAVGFPPSMVAVAIPVAITEALANAILRGNGEDVRKMVRVRMQLDSDALLVEICDEGAGFDLLEAMRDPTTPDRIECEDGRGLFLMHALVDAVEQFRDVPGGLNVVRLTVRRP
jgi:serine/threonine-protein kinase RsbW